MRLASAAHVDLIAREIIQEQATHLRCRSGVRLFTVKGNIYKKYTKYRRRNKPANIDVKEALLVGSCVSRVDFFFGFDFVAATEL